MENDGDGGESPRAKPLSNSDNSAEETAAIISGGSFAGSRSAIFSLLAVFAIIAGGLHYHFSQAGGDNFLVNLDAELLADAEISLDAAEVGNRMIVVPSWPLRLYSALRKDMAFYFAMTALAAMLWGISARARARRDAYLMYSRLAGELAEIKNRLDAIDPNAKQTTTMDSATKGQ